MKKFLIILILSSLLPLSIFAQQSVLSSFNGYGDIVNVIDVDPTDSLFTIEINNFYGSPRFQPFGPWIAQDVQVGMVMWVDCARFVITNVNSASFSTMNIDVKVPSVDWNLGVATPLPNSRCAVVFEDQYLLTALPAPADGNSGALSGINNTLFACMLNHYSQALLVTKNSVNEITDYVAGLDTIPSEAPGPNIGETWRNSVGQLFYSDGTQWLTDKEVKFSNASLEGLPSYLYKLGIDTLGQDTLYISNNGIFRRFQSGLVYKEGYGINIFAIDSIEVDTNQIATQYDISLLPTGIDTFQLNNDTLKLSLVNDFEPFKKVILPVVGINSGTGISTSSTSGIHTITNTAPDQIVSITGAGISNVTGTYPNFTVTSTEVDGSVNNEGSLSVGAGTGTTSIIQSNTSGSNPITLTGAGITTVNETGNTITITSTEVDGSTTNELQTLSTVSNTVTLSNSGGSFTIAGAGINTVATAGTTITVTGTEVDGSTTNELQTLSTGTNTLTLSNGGGTVTVDTNPSDDVTGSGADGQIAYFNGTKTITSDAILTYDKIRSVNLSSDRPTINVTATDNANFFGFIYQFGASPSPRFRFGYQENVSQFYLQGTNTAGNFTATPSLLINRGANNNVGINLAPGSPGPSSQFVVAGNSYIAGANGTAAARLHVVGADALAAGWTAQFHNSSTNNALMIRNDGFIGIGTATQSSGIVNFEAATRGRFHGGVEFGSTGVARISNTGDYFKTATGSSGFGFYNNSSLNATVGDYFWAEINSGINPTSGSANFSILKVSPTLNITGTAAPTVIGIDYNPILTSVLGNHYAAVFRSGRVGIGTADPTDQLHTTGSVRLQNYPNTLNSTGNPVNVLSTSSTGVVESHPISEVISSAGGVTGSGVAGQVTFWNGTSTVSGNNGLVWYGNAVGNFSGLGVGAIQFNGFGTGVGMVGQGFASLGANRTLYMKSGTNNNVNDVAGIIIDAGVLGNRTASSSFSGLQLISDLQSPAGSLTSYSQFISAPLVRHPITTFIGYDYNPNFESEPTNNYAALFRRGRVGIGLSAPTAQLHVRSTGTLSTATALLVQNGAATPANLLSVLDNGDVGIGTNAPGAKLQINGSGITSSTSSLRLVDNNSTQYFNATDDGQLTLGKNVTLNTASAYRVFQGNPILTNTVSGGLYQDVAFFSGGLTYAGSEPFFGARAMQFAASNRNTSISNQIWGAFFVAQNETTTARASQIRGMDIILINNATGGTIGEVTGIRVALSTHAVGSTISNTAGIVIDDLTPTTAGTQTNVYSIYSSDANARMYHAGNVGIGAGVQSPTRTLDINGETRIRDLTTTTATGLVGADADGVLSNVTFASAVSQGGGLTGNGVTNYLAQYNSSNTLDTTGIIWTGGRMGIGTATPSTRLEAQAISDAALVGSTNLASGFASTVVGSWTYDTLNTRWNHVVGNTNTLTATVSNISSAIQIYRATVTIVNRTAGSIRLSLKGSSWPVALTGTSTIYFEQVNTANNLVVTPTSDFNGSVSIVINSISALPATTSLKNTSGTVVYEERATTSSYNVIQGVNAGMFSVSGNGRIFIGRSAGKNSVTSGNIAIGTEAGMSNYAGGGWAAIGSQAGTSNISGINWYAIGAGAGQLNVSGNNWFAIGTNAARFNRTGSSFVAIGERAAYVDTTASAFVAIGNSAAFNHLAGSAFVAIGAEAAAYYTGAGFTSATDFSNGVYIGYQTRVGANGAANETVIGYQALGLGTNTTRIGNSNTIQTHLDGRLTIGNTFYDSRVAARIVGADASTSNYSLVVTDSDGATSTTVDPNFVVRNDGNVGIGTYSPTAKLQINGSGNTSATTALTVQNSDNNSMFYVENNGGTYVQGRGASNVFFVKSSSGSNLFYVQNIGAIGFTAYTWVPESSAGAVILDASISRSWNIGGNAKTVTAGVAAPFIVNTGFAPTSGTATYNGLTVNPTINQTGGANGITRGIYVNPTLTLAADWRSIEWNNSTGYGLYGAGTAPNYLAGSLGIGATSPARLLHVQGEARISDLTTDTPTRIVGADADGDLGEITLGSGLSITSGVLNTSSTLNTGSGTTGQVTFWNGTNSITGINTFTFNNSTVSMGLLEEVSRTSYGRQNSSGDVHVGSSGLGGPTVGSQDYGYYIAHNAFRNNTGAWVHSRTATIPAVRHFGGAGVSQGLSGFSWDYSTNVGTSNITWTNLMSLSTSGNLSVGTSTASAKFHVVGAGTTTGYGLIVTDVNNATATASLVVQDNGRVGIGTNAPSTKLDVIGDVEFQNPTTSYDGGILGAELLSGANATTGWTGTSFITGGFKHDSLTTPLVSTFSPANNQFYQIAITVTGRTAGSFTFTFGGYTSSTLTASFTVGPLTTSTGALTITPTADFNGTITASVKVITNGTATFIGRNSAGSLAYEERYYAQFTNMSLGASSGRKITTGFNNALLGYQAGVDITTGNNNVFLGYRSGFKNTIGDNNMFIGNSAGFENLSGRDNAFIGGSAGYANTAGIYNVAIGSTALRLNTSGSSNIAIGYSAGYSSTGGSNVFIGVSSGYNTTSNNNLIIGTSAGLNNTTGANNVLLGTDAGRNFGTGTDNATIISNSIIIGRDARPLGNNQSNQIVIGDSGRGLGANTTRIGSGSNTNQTHLDGRLTVGNTLYDVNTTARIVGLNNTSSTYALVVTNSTAGTNTTSTPALVVTNTQNIGIGTYSPAKLFHVNGEVRISDLDNGTATRIVGATADGDLDELTLGSGLSITSGTISVTNPISASEVFIESSTATTIDLDANTGVVKDVNGTNASFTLPTDLSRLNVYKNGIRLARTGSATTRDFSVNTGTNEITFTTALLSTDRIVIVKI